MHIPSHLPACHAVEEVLLGSDASQEAARDKAAGPQREVIGCEGGQGPAAAHQRGPTTLQLDLSQQAGDLLAVGLHTHTHTHTRQSGHLHLSSPRTSQPGHLRPSSPRDKSGHLHLSSPRTSQPGHLHPSSPRDKSGHLHLSSPRTSQPGHLRPSSPRTSQVISIFQVLGQVSQVIFISSPAVKPSSSHPDVTLCG